MRYVPHPVPPDPENLNGGSLFPPAVLASDRHDSIVRGLSDRAERAGRSDSAFSFLTNATTPRFWAENGAWISEKGPDEFGILASLSIVAIGMSGRAEVPRILSEMKKQPLKNDFDPTPFARRFDGAVVDAAFYHALIRDRGRDSFLARFFGATDVIDPNGSRARWEATEEGKSWMEWYNLRQ